MNGGPYGQQFGGQGQYNPYGQPQFSQQVNQTLGKATNATKNLFAKIGAILKNPVGELKAIAEAGSSSLGLQMIGFNLAVLVVLVLIALLSLRAKMGEYSRYVSIPYFQTIFVCVVTMAIYYFAEAGIPMEPENSDDLIRILLNLKSDPGLCQKLGNNAYQNICSKYNRDQQAKDYIVVLENVLKSHLKDSSLCRHNLANSYSVARR